MLINVVRIHRRFLCSKVLALISCAGRSDMPLMQAKKNTMMGVLYAVPSYLTDRAWLMRQPCLNGFHEALTALPDSTARLTGLALFVRLCVVETPTNDFSPFLPPMTLQLYCIKAQSIGLFDLLYTTLTHVLKVCDSSQYSAWTCCPGNGCMCVMV